MWDQRTVLRLTKGRKGGQGTGNSKGDAETQLVCDQLRGQLWIILKSWLNRAIDTRSTSVKEIIANSACLGN